MLELALIMALILVALLAFWVGRMAGQLKDAQQRSGQASTRSATARDAARDAARSSIQVLARCILADQVEYSEACIRIKVLLDALPESERSHPELEIFETLWQALAHHPTHAARDDLDKRERWTLDRERWTLEETHGEAIRRGARRLLETFSGPLGSED
jgi:hypothetical protein